MVCYVFGKNNQCNRSKCEEYRQNSRAVEFYRSVGNFLYGVYQNDIRHPVAEVCDACKCAEVYEVKVFVTAGVITYKGSDYCHKITCADSDNEGDKFHALSAFYGNDNGYEKGYYADKYAHKVIIVCAYRNIHKIVHGGTGKAQTDKGNGRSDYYRRHQLVYPVRSGKLDDDSNYRIHKSGEHRSEDNSAISEGYARSQRHYKCEGRSEEYRAFEFGKQQIDYRTYAGAYQSRRLAKLSVACRRIAVYKYGYEHGCRYNSKHLLESVQKVFAERRFLVYFVSKLHKTSPWLFYRRKYNTAKHKKSNA